jgi:hypothetical protein
MITITKMKKKKQTYTIFVDFFDATFVIESREQEAFGILSSYVESLRTKMKNSYNKLDNIRLYQFTTAEKITSYKHCRPQYDTKISKESYHIVWI